MSRNFKRLISIFVASSLVSMTFSFAVISPASAETVETVACGDGGNFTIVDNEISAEMVSYDCAGYVIIPTGVTKIEYGSFQGNSNITGVLIPASVATIEIGAFGWNGLLQEIEVDPNNPYFSSHFGVLYNKDRTELLFYPTNSPYRDFIVPAGVTKIRTLALDRASSLRMLMIPDSVIDIGQSDSGPLFDGNYALTAILVASGNPKYSSDSGVLFNKDKSEIIYFPVASTLTSYSIPDSVTKIKQYAFQYANNLQSVTIPDSVITIGQHAFYGSQSLTSLSIGQNVRTIGDYAFSELRSLTGITLPNSVEKIGRGIFQENRNMTSAVLSSALTEIPDQAFYRNESLTAIVIPDAVTTIGRYAFTQNFSLTSVIIPAAVTLIREEAFSVTSNLTSVTFLSTYSPEVKNFAFYRIAEGATVSFPTGAIGYCGSRTWRGLILPEGTPPCEPNCSAITGGSVTETADAWTLSWDPFSYRNKVESLDIYVISGDEERDWYTNPTGRYIVLTSVVTISTLKVAKSEIENLAQEHDLTSFTFLIKKMNYDDNCYPVTELGTIAIAKSPAELARLAEVARLAAIAKARDVMLALLKTENPLTVALLNEASIPGSTDKNINLINGEIAKLSPDARTDLTQVQKIVRKYELLGALVSAKSAAQRLHILIELGLIPANSKNKMALADSIKTLDSAERADFKTVKATIDAKAREIQERAARIAEIQKRLALHA